MMLCRGKQLVQQLAAASAPPPRLVCVTPVTLPPGRLRLATSPSWTGSAPIPKTIGIVVVAIFAASAAGIAVRGNHGHLTANQISRQCRQSIVLAVRPAVLYRHVSVLEIAGVLQALAEPTHNIVGSIRRSGAEEPDDRHRRLLRARRERPRNRTTKQRDELAPNHSITSSARASTVGGMSRPSAFADLRLMTSSYLVGACTGRSAGFAPLRMRST